MVYLYYSNLMVSLLDVNLARFQLTTISVFYSALSNSRIVEPFSHDYSPDYINWPEFVYAEQKVKSVRAVFFKLI